MAHRPTISDVAREADVSIATVDRVLNGRQRVREETKQRVYEAAQRIGYHAANLIGRSLETELPEYKLGFILQKERQSFYQTFTQEIEAAVSAAPGIRGRCVIDFAASQSHEEIAGMIEEMGKGVDAVAAAAVNHQAVTSAVTALKAKGVPSFAMLNDFAQGQRAAYIGLNNLKIGRIAAWVIATAVHGGGKVGIFVGGHRWHGHELRETGFRSYFREYAPRFQLLDTLFNLETRQLTYEAMLDLLARQPDLRGVYIAGGGMEGAIAALRETREPGDVALVVNELTPDSRSALTDRYVTTVISTPLHTVCREVVDLMVSAADARADVAPSQHFFDPLLYTPESV